MKREVLCPRCGMEEIAPMRLSLGYKVCLTCGEDDAKLESEKKRNRIAIAFPKGAYQYITEEHPLEDLG